jgi:hypothetical protein
MEAEPVLLRFIEARSQFFTELDLAKRQLDTLLNDMIERPPTMADIALLEGLHAQKHRLFIDFVQKEDAFVTRLLEVMRKRDQQT